MPLNKLQCNTKIILLLLSSNMFIAMNMFSQNRTVNGICWRWKIKETIIFEHVRELSYVSHGYPSTHPAIHPVFFWGKSYTTAKVELEFIV